jgi:hypothetical protein
MEGAPGDGAFRAPCRNLTTTVRSFAVNVPGYKCAWLQTGICPS